MKINSLKKYIPEKFIATIKQEKITSLYPAQVEAIKKGIFEGENLVISTPTASGKTLIASLAIIQKFQNPKAKVLYVVPLIALASEKYKYYKEFFKGDCKVAVSVGDLDSLDPWLAQYQLIVVTSEKLDSLIRHGAEWVNEVELIIVDEIHLLSDSSRGPTLEVLLTLLRKKLPKAQFLGLSATINNGTQLSDWLGAQLVESKFRPVTLYEGVCFESKVRFPQRKFLRLNKPQESGIVKDTLEKRKKQILIFVSTRRSSESLAEKTSREISKYLKKDELEQLDKLSEKILHQLEQPTSQCQRLAQVIKNGVAFHHAGLLSAQKSLIEDNFRKGLLKVISATPTLALGVNLPAFRVLVRDIKRYYPGSGSLEIPVLEYKQFVGRAGRPQYDKFGESILIARSEEEAKGLTERYILGRPEDIESKLAQEASLRIHSLSLIAAEFCLSLESLLEFFSLSFFGFQYKDTCLIEDKIKKILRDLQAWGLISVSKNILFATKLGKRISQLYLDPQSAFRIVESLEQAEELGLREIGVLQAICYIAEMRPGLKLKTKELGILNDVINRNREFFLMDVPLMWDENYRAFLSSVKTAFCLEAWINESSENQLLEIFGITPGELRRKLEIADWLLYCFIEIAALLKRKEYLSLLRKLRVRLNYGVKEELLRLVSLREIGRIRSRRLFESGIKDTRDLKKVPVESLANILGPKVALRIRGQLFKG